MEGTGERVFFLLAGGGYAEKVAVPRAMLMPIPRSTLVRGRGGDPRGVVHGVSESVSGGRAEGRENAFSSTRPPRVSGRPRFSSRSARARPSSRRRAAREKCGALVALGRGSRRRHVPRGVPEPHRADLRQGVGRPRPRPRGRARSSRRTSSALRARRTARPHREHGRAVGGRSTSASCSSSASGSSDRRSGAGRSTRRSTSRPRSSSDVLPGLRRRLARAGGRPRASRSAAAAEAHRRMAANENVGKIVLVVD